MSKVKKICKTCKSIFYVVPSRSKEAKYCSIKCYGIALKNKPTWNKGISIMGRHYAKSVMINFPLK